MSSTVWRVGLLLVVITGTWGGLMAQPSSPPALEAQRQHGKYLVEHVAMCVQCHTPRLAQGEIDRTRLLQGAPVPISSPFPAQPWAYEAPKIAGLPGWTVEDAIRLLQTGIGARGYAPRPPMPSFRMTPEDAAAVVTYLKSLQ